MTPARKPDCCIACGEPLGTEPSEPAGWAGRLHRACIAEHVRRLEEMTAEAVRQGRHDLPWVPEGARGK